MSVTTVIVAHERRAAQVPELEVRVGAHNVFMDNDGPKGLGEWPNHRRAIIWAAWHAMKNDHDHVCIVQDDALPIDGFTGVLGWVLDTKPDDMIGLYVGTHRPRDRGVTEACAEADQRGARWLSHPELLWGVATAFPARYVPGMLVHADKSTRPYDLRLGRAWRAERGIKKPVLYTWPSLVDHRDEESVIAGRGKAQGVRVARRVGDPRDTWAPLTDEIVVEIEPRYLPSRVRNGKKPLN